jgi:undecaprenyl diphosphate synthase
MATSQNSLITPRHVGFIVDGNRRWARQKGLPTLEGHSRGYALLKQVGEELIDRGVDYVSGYIFSIENWKRTEEEVSYLMNLALKYATTELDEVIDKDIRIRFLGTKERLNKKLIKAMQECEERSAHCTRGTLALCFNYSGQQEIVDACRAIAAQNTEPSQITTETLEQALYQTDVPEVDLIVRTSGEQRLSNFMLWRAAYSELLFLDKNWPEIDPKKDVDYILEQYALRQRRFGG